jgi:uncharacterized protein
MSESRKTPRAGARKAAAPPAKVASGRGRKGGAGKMAPARRRRTRAAARGPKRSATAPVARRGQADGATDPEGVFVARIRGEEAVREAPHPLSEAAADTGARVPEGVPLAPAEDERLGELPWGYADDAFAALPRDPRSLFLYWDHAQATIHRGFEGMDDPRAQLWLFRRAGAGWERARVQDLALESRGFYVHDLEPGAVYRAELRAVDRTGRDRLLGRVSNEVVLPPDGPSPVVDDRFVRLPWDRRLGPPLGPGHTRPPLPDEDRRALAGLSQGPPPSSSGPPSSGGR